jgi:hypothetical protein
MVFFISARTRSSIPEVYLVHVLVTVFSLSMFECAPYQSIVSIEAVGLNIPPVGTLG